MFKAWLLLAVALVLSGIAGDVDSLWGIALGLISGAFGAFGLIVAYDKGRNER